MEQTLKPTQRRKVFPAAGVALLTHYSQPDRVPPWSDIGTDIQQKLRDDMTKHLRLTASNDVADFLDKHEEQANKFLHQKVKSMREKRKQGEIAHQSCRSIAEASLVSPSGPVTNNSSTPLDSRGGEEVGLATGGSG